MTTTFGAQQSGDYNKKQLEKAQLDTISLTQGKVQGKVQGRLEDVRPTRTTVSMLDNEVLNTMMSASLPKTEDKHPTQVPGSELCDKTIFIATLLTLLYDNDMCFTRGAFVFEDPRGILFDKLITSGFKSPLITSTKPCSSVNLNMGCNVTLKHNDFLLNEKFSARHKVSDGYTLDEVKNVYHNVGKCPGGAKDKFKSHIYEIVFNESIPQVCKYPLPIKSMLVYSFFVRNRGNAEFRYLYLKLDSTSVAETGKNAVKYMRSIFNSRKDGMGSNGLPTRIERDWDTYGIIRDRDIDFYTNLQKKWSEIIKDTNVEKLSEYNEHVRLGSEFFITEDILTLIFKIMDEPNTVIQAQ